MLFPIPGCHPVKIPHPRGSRSVPGDCLVSGGADRGAGGLGHHDKDRGQHGHVPR